MTETITTVNNEKLPGTFEVITVERYTRLERLDHWVHVLIMILFFFTGFELFSQTYFIGSEYFTQIFHFALGGIIACWYLFFYSYFIFKYKKFNEIFPTPQDFRDLIIILLCKIKILPDSRYPRYDYYIFEEKKYGMKFHPAQKFLSLMNLLAIFTIGSTGIVMSETLFPDYLPGIFTAFFSLIVFPLELLAIDLRFIHQSMYFYFILTTIVHFFLAIIPQNRNRLIGMVTGSEKIPISPRTDDLSKDS